MKIKWKKVTVTKVTVTLVTVTFLSSLCFAEPAPPKFYDIPAQSAKPAAPGTGQVKEIFEANVLQLETGEWIRLLGIQPTRKVEVRRAAIDWMLQEVKGKAVKLEYDKQLHDAMGRMLAYVTLETTPPQTGPIQEDLLWRGLVYTSKRYPCKQFSRFRRYEKEARKAKRGIWEGI